MDSKARIAELEAEVLRNHNRAADMLDKYVVAEARAERLEARPRTRCCCPQALECAPSISMNAPSLLHSTLRKK
jgi:hypothetical protein